MFNPPRDLRTRFTLLALLMALAGNACIYDSTQRCGPAMTFVEAVAACVCDSNAIAVPGGCQACAADEVATGGKCGCAAEQTKNDDNVCATAVGLGDPCDTATVPCSHANYSYCAVRGSGTAGTCTKACAGNTDCDAAYTCATWEAPPYCRTFEGAGASCGSASDCVGDAKYCDTFQTHSCVVSGCSLSAHDCPRGTMCTDLSFYGLGNLCVGAP
jgi:hypothetical protein